MLDSEKKDLFIVKILEIERVTLNLAYVCMFFQIETHAIWNHYSTLNLLVHSRKAIPGISFTRI